MNYQYHSNPRFGGLLLPFLAGVAVTSPLVFFAKNQQNYPPYPPYPPYPMPYPAPYYYPPYPVLYR